MARWVGYGFAWWTAACALTLTAAAGLAAPGVTDPATAAVTPPTVRAQYAEAYLEHPVVVEVRSAGYLTLVTRERALDRRIPSDKALAIIDAIGPEGVASNNVDPFVTQAIQARLTLGPSGALRKQDITVDNLDARQALVLGWVRTLASGSDAKVLTRRNKKLDKAGAIQLLEKAVALAPEHQAPKLALALAKATAGGTKKQQCGLGLGLLEAARAGGNESVQLDAAERVAALAAPFTAACKPKQLEPFAGPILLPAPVAETAIVDRSGRPASRPDGSPTPSLHALGVPFVVAAPFFRAYADKPQVARLIAFTRLDEIALEDVLKTDTTGDLALAVLNASVLMQRIGSDDNAAVAWAAILRRHGLINASADQQKSLRIDQLTPIEAVVLGYAQALAGKGLKPIQGASAFTAMPADLFAFGRPKLPAASLLGPVVAQAHLIDLERQSNLGMPLPRIEGLRSTLQKSTLPVGAKEQLERVLGLAESQCRATQPAAAPVQAKPPTPQETAR